MAALRHDRYLDALTEQSGLFAKALGGADLRQPVPTCPDWTLHQLAEHVGQAHRWSAAMVSRRATAPVDRSEVEDVRAPEDAAEALDQWLRAGAAELVDALREAGPDTPVWTWAADQRAGFWARRMTHETVVHRADAELARGRTVSLDPELAADGLSEWLDIMCSPQARKYRPELAELCGDGQILHLHSTDPGLGEAGEWIIRRTPSGPVWERGHTKGAVAVRGAAVDLLLVMLRRIAPGDAQVQVLGDPAVLEHWLANTRF